MEKWVIFEGYRIPESYIEAWRKMLAEGERIREEYRRRGNTET